MSAIRRVTGRLAAVAMAIAALAAMPAAAGAASHVAISGSGSSWSALAIDQWQQDVRPSGIVVNYSPDGSAAGRADYMANQDDFAASDPPFRNGSDQLANTGSEHPNQGYSYIPDTAGGTAFMYHLTVAGHLVTNLRLSGLTVAKIFTGQITNWADPAVTHDYGAQLPTLPITPVVRSDGSGATFFLTRWMAHEYPALWDGFCKRVHAGVQLPCGQSEFYPTNFGNAKAQNGSNNVATYITSSYGNGAIGYDEYAYALNSHYPVVRLLNPAGYFVLPSASNVAVALTRAVINSDASSTDFLQQNLDSVYTFTDPRSYPLSSYSYLIAPRTGSTEPTNFSPAKGATLSTFVNFLLCAGQQQMAPLGYSPLPLNLVKGGLLQVNRIPGHVATPNPVTLAGCNNPTFTNGQLTLLTTAQQPSPCDKLGEPLNCVLINGKASAPGAAAGKTAAPAAARPSLSAAARPAAGALGAGLSGPAPASSATSSPGAAAAAGAGPGPTAAITGQVVNVAASGANKVPLSILTAAAIVAAIAVPPALGAWLRRRRRAQP